MGCHVMCELAVFSIIRGALSHLCAPNISNDLHLLGGGFPDRGDLPQVLPSSERMYQKPSRRQQKTPNFHTVSSGKKIKNVSERRRGQNAPAGPTPETLQISMYKTGFLGSAYSDRKWASPCKPSAATFDFQLDRLGAAFSVRCRMAVHLELQNF